MHLVCICKESKRFALTTVDLYQQEFEDHVSKDHGSGPAKGKKTPWGTSASTGRSPGRSSPRGAGDGSYNLRATPQRSVYQTKSSTEKPSTFGSATRRPAAGVATTATRPFGLAAKRSTLGFAASRYKPTTTKRPTSFGLAAKRSAVGGPAASARSATTTRQSAYNSPRDTRRPISAYAPPSEKTSRYESIAVGSKRGASNITSGVGTTKRAKMSPTSRPISMVSGIKRIATLQNK